MTTYNIARSIKPKDVLGQPKPLLDAMKKNEDGSVIDGQTAIMGYLFGTAKRVKVSRREMPSGEMQVYYGLEGEFEGLDVNADKGTKAPVIYLAQHIHDMIANELKNDGKGVENENGADRVQFAFEVGIQSSKKSSAGFVWTYAPKTAPAEYDPLAALRAVVAGDKLPALAAPKVETPAPETAPETKPAGKK